MKIDVIDAILELETLGYHFTLDEGRLRYSCQGARPDAKIVRPLHAMIKTNRNDVISWIKEYADAIRVDCLFIAADQAETMARQAEKANDLALAHHHWKRFARFFAAGAEASGADTPTIPWPEWIASFDDYDGSDPNPIW